MQFCQNSIFVETRSTSGVHSYDQCRVSCRGYSGGIATVENSSSSVKSGNPAVLAVGVGVSNQRNYLMVRNSSGLTGARMAMRG